VRVANLRNDSMKHPMVQKTNKNTLTDSEIPSLLNMLFKIMDFNMICWNIYLLVSAVVLGWIFSSKDSLVTKQKLFISILYTLAIALNSLALHMMDKNWLSHILKDLKLQAISLDDTTPGIKEMFMDRPSKLFILPGKNLVWLVTAVAWPSMMACVWIFR
jgi:hypothetical protein